MHFHSYYGFQEYPAMARRVYGKTGCSVEATLSVMGGTWKPVILFYLVPGTKRFMELARLIPNATQSMLTSQLRELEADGVVVRHVYPEVPPKVEYRLTELGQTLVPVLLAMRDWGTAYKKMNREKAVEGGAEV